MINTTLYKLKSQYTASLKSRIEAGFVCPDCSKMESTVEIQKVDRDWTIVATCSCGKTYDYAEDASFRGYVNGQYKYVLKSANPTIKFKYIEDDSKYIAAEPEIIDNPKKFPDFKFSNSSVSKYKKE